MSTAIESVAESPALHFPDRYGGFDIAQSEIVWVEAKKDYALIHTKSRSFMLRTTMADLAGQLHPPIVRVHRSAYVALDRVQRSVASGKGVFSLVLSEDLTVQVGSKLRSIYPNGITQTRPRIGVSLRQAQSTVAVPNIVSAKRDVS